MVLEMSLVVYTHMAFWILSCFDLIYFKIFSAYKTYFRIGENQRVWIHHIKCDMYFIFTYLVHLGNTMGDCCEDESDICVIKTNNLDGRKRR